MTVISKHGFDLFQVQQELTLSQPDVDCPHILTNACGGVKYIGGMTSKVNLRITDVR